MTGEIVNEYNVVTKGLHDGKTENNVTTNGENIRYADEELENKVLADLNRKIELGQEVNKNE